MFFLNAGNPGPVKNSSQNEWARKKVHRRRIRSVKVYSDQYTKKHPNGEPVRNASKQKVKEIVPCLTK